MSISYLQSYSFLPFHMNNNKKKILFNLHNLNEGIWCLERTERLRSPTRSGILKITHSVCLIWIHDELISRIWLLSLFVVCLHASIVLSVTRSFLPSHPPSSNQTLSMLEHKLFFASCLPPASFSYRRVCAETTAGKQIQALSNFAIECW